MSEVSICPYCNAQFASDQAKPTPRGLLCPRCGELLPADQLATVVAPAPASAAYNSAPTIPDPNVKQRSRWIVGGIIVLIMAGMAMISLEFALQTTPFRRANDRKTIPVEPIAAPTEWSALGYLPANCNLIAGTQVKDLVSDPLGKKLLAEPRPQLLDLALKQLEKWTRLKLDDIHHVVAGLHFDGKIPQVQIVVGTRDPYRVDALADALKLDRMEDHRGKRLFGFRLQPLGEGRLWCPDPQTLVLILRVDGFSKGDLDGLPYPPRNGSNGLSKAMQEVLTRRLDKHSALWIVGHGDWQPLLSLIPKDKLGGAGKDAELLAGVKTFALSLALEKDISFHGQLFTGDASVTEMMRKALLHLAEKAPLQVEGSPAEAGPEAQWLTLRRTVTIEQARQWLGQ